MPPDVLSGSVVGGEHGIRKYCKHIIMATSNYKSKRTKDDTSDEDFDAMEQLPIFLVISGENKQAHQQLVKLSSFAIGKALTIILGKPATQRMRSGSIPIQNKEENTCRRQIDI